MKYLVDTNVISEVRKGARANPNVIRWWASVDQGDVYLSVLALGEIRWGIIALNRRDAKQARFLQAWLNGLRLVFASRLVPLDENSALNWAEIRSNRTLPLIDSLMAAAALSRRMVFVTRNTKDIVDLNIEYLNPFES